MNKHLKADTAEQYLIEALRKGNEDAYRTVFDRHYAVMCKFALGFLRDSYLAQSIASDVIFHIWEIRKNIFVQQSLRGYLLQAVKRRCLNHLHSNYLRREVQVSQLSRTYETGHNQQTEHFIDLIHPLRQLLDVELGRKIADAIESLPTECREVFKLSRFGNCNYYEISQRMGISVNTVKYHIKNALRQLRLRLDSYVNK